MNAAVCVLVTVPTEPEEQRRQRLHTKRFCCHSVSHTSGKRDTLEPELPANAPLELVLRTIVEQLRLEQVFWSQDVDGAQLQARCDLQQDERYERLLSTLQSWGIGERPGTHVTALNCLETRRGAESAHATTDAAGATTRNAAEAAAGARLGWQNFMDSVRCRLNVNQVVRAVRRDATINFDFVVLLVAAALLSCVGLVENSFLFLSSSMLISPLMGPIIAGIFGSVIGDRGLRWLGIRNELIGLAISIAIGFVFGCAICLGGLARHFVLASGFTEEIMTRCDTHSLAIGLVTALASGAAAAIGVLGGNTGSLVGVAISASLLPPAVNAGLLGAIALCMQLLHVDGQLLESLAKHRSYSQQLHIELFICAMVSMALTLLNVLCVWLMGVIVLHIKEVAPAVQRRDQQFWRHDVRLAREVALHDPELHSAIDRLASDERRHIDLEATQYQHTWSPGMLQAAAVAATAAAATAAAAAATSATSATSATGATAATGAATESEAQGGRECNYHTVHGFQDFCITLHKLKRPATTTTTTTATAATTPPLPSFMEVFTPLPSKQPEKLTTPPPPAAAAAAATTSMDAKKSDSCQLCLQRSLPDLRPRQKPKLPRCVHWPEEQRHQPTHSHSQSQSHSHRQSHSQSQSHSRGNSGGYHNNRSPSPHSPQSYSATSRGTHSRHAGQVLLPLPLDRRLRVLRSRSKENSDECDYEHEFNV